GESVGAMAPDVAGDLPSAGGVSDVDRVLQVELFDECCEVVRVGVEVVAVPRLARAAMAPAIVRDAAIAARRQEEHLVFERVPRERPTVAEDHGLPDSPQSL